MAREMKDSGIEWIGEIPREWEIRKLKTYISFVNGFAFDGSILEKEGTYPVIRIGDIKGGTIDFKNACFINKADEELEQFRVEKGDILIAMSGATVGKLAFVTSEPPICFINQRVGIIRGSLGKYLYYYLSTDNFMKYILLLSEGTAQPNISTKNINNYFAVIPPETIREQIVSLLEIICDHIDTVIEKTHAAIEEFKKLKQAVITQAVTKGIRPNREMKDSGIEWIGKMPEDWMLIPFRHVLNERNEKNSPIRSTERLSLSIDLGVTLYSEKTTNLDRFKDDFDQYKIAHEGDLVMNSMNMIVGATGVSPYYGCVSPAYYTFFDDTENHITAKFCEYIFRSKTMLRVLFSMGKGIYAIVRGDDRVNTCRLKVSREDLRSIQLPIPSLDEQSEIVAYLDKKTAAIDSLIQKKEQLITELEAYKKSLIYEYVTGKKEVIIDDIYSRHI